MARRFTIPPWNIDRARAVLLQHLNTVNRSQVGKCRRGQLMVTRFRADRETDGGNWIVQVAMETGRTTQLRITGTGRRFQLFPLMDTGKLFKRLTELSVPMEKS